MKLVEINWNPTDRQLRQFGVVCLVALPTLGWVWGGGWPVVLILAAIGLGGAILGWAAPQTLKPVFVVFSLAAMPFGVVLGELAMLLIYFGCFLPLAIIMRCVKRDALQLKLDRRAKTYWRKKAPPKDAASYFRQF